MDRLVGLLLDLHTKWSALHNCLQHCEAHLMRDTLWNLLAPPLHTVTIELVCGMCDIVGDTL